MKMNARVGNNVFEAKENSKEKAKAGMRLSIIDGNKLLRTVYKYTLLEHDTIQSVEVFENIRNLINYINAKNNIDVVMLELQNNTRKEFDAIRKIKETHPEIKIIVTTSFDDENIISEALSLGINAYVSKDIDFDELYNIVYSVFKGAIWIDFKAASVVKDAFKEQIITKAENELLDKLTSREKEVLKYLSKGLSNPEISKKLNISSHTVKAHVSNIIMKLGVADRVQAAVFASKHKFI